MNTTFIYYLRTLAIGDNHLARCARMLLRLKCPNAYAMKKRIAKYAAEEQQAMLDALADLKKAYKLGVQTREIIVSRAAGWAALSEGHIKRIMRYE